MITHVGARPLSGIRVVEFGSQVAGPLVAMLLGDAGAEVVRICRPGQGATDTQASAVLDRSKHSVEIDLTTAAGRAKAERLVDGADVLVEGFRPGVMARLGFGADVCAARNPGLVYCSVPGFSHDGPRAGIRGCESIVAAATSIYRPPRVLGPAGPEVGTAPAILDVPLISTYAAIIAAHGVVAALIARERDGLGQTVESSLYDAAFEIEYPGRIWDKPLGQQHRGWSPGNHLYRGSDDRWLAVVAHGTFNPNEWSFTEMPAAESVTRLLAAGHRAYLVQLGDEMGGDPIAVERGISLGDNVGIIKRLSRSPLPPYTPTGAPGSDGEEILATLNLADHWADLISSGAIVNVGAVIRSEIP
jgi:crotonobetainyl-CoA:carnitine CoA-transferase CaiB-like acyl-CoA transferase